MLSRSVCVAGRCSQFVEHCEVGISADVLIPEHSYALLQFAFFIFTILKQGHLGSGGSRRATTSAESVVSSPVMFQRCCVLSMTFNSSRACTFFFFQEGHCVAGLGPPFMPNDVVLTAGGCGNVPVPLLACPKSVERIVSMDQRGLPASFAGALFRAPRDTRKRLTKFMNKLFHPVK